MIWNFDWRSEKREWKITEKMNNFYKWWQEKMWRRTNREGKVLHWRSNLSSWSIRGFFFSTLQSSAEQRSKTKSINKGNRVLFFYKATQHSHSCLIRDNTDNYTEAAGTWWKLKLQPRGLFHKGIQIPALAKNYRAFIFSEKILNLYESVSPGKEDELNKNENLSWPISQKAYTI